MNKTIIQIEKMHNVYLYKIIIHFKYLTISFDNYTSTRVKKWNKPILKEKWQNEKEMKPNPKSFCKNKKYEWI